MQNILIFSLLTDLWADEGDGEAEFDLNCKEAGAGGEGSKMCAGVKVAAPAVPGDEAGGEVTAEVADDADVVVVVAVASAAAVWAAVLWWYGLKYG